MRRLEPGDTIEPANDASFDDAPAPRFDIVARDSGERFACADVEGFDAARACSLEVAEAPARLALVGATDAARAWLDAWAEDDERVHRSIAIERRADGVSVNATVTLAAFGRGVDTELAIESIAREGASGLARSGVHPRASAEAP